MSERDDLAPLHDIDAALKRMLRFVAGLDKAGFLANEEKCYAVLAQLVIIGEAANRLPESLREASPTIPWRQIIGTRNRVVHGYDVIDWNIVWDVASVHGPALQRAIQELLGAPPE